MIWQVLLNVLKLKAVQESLSWHLLKHSVMVIPVMVSSTGEAMHSPVAKQSGETLAEMEWVYIYRWIWVQLGYCYEILTYMETQSSLLQLKDVRKVKDYKKLKSLYSRNEIKVNETEKNSI